MRLHQSSGLAQGVIDHFGHGTASGKWPKLECSLLEISSSAIKSCKKDQKVHKAIENGHLYWIYRDFP
jgi:hypothetical protein